MPEPIPNLIPLVLINGAISAAVAVIVPAFLLSRFTRDIIGRSVLVIFLFVAAGAYFGFATLGRDVVDTQPIWMLVELAPGYCFWHPSLARSARLPVLACRRMGVASLLGRCASLHRAGTLIYSLDLRYRVYQFRLAGCHLYRHLLWTTWRPQAGIPRGHYLAEAPPGSSGS